jgi:hypothetical protein
MGINNTEGKLPLVSTITGANFFIGTTGVVDTAGKLAIVVHYIGSKFSASVKDTVGTISD